MCHYYLGNYDSSTVYLSRASQFFKEDSIKLLSIIPFQMLSDLKHENKTNIEMKIKTFEKIALNKDPLPADYVLTNWAMYEALINLDNYSGASSYLEDAYFEIKARSKNIRDKKDRNQYMQTNLHKKIATAWAKK